jgi:hypothetical protein
MLGFKSFDAAQDTLVGIELMHMIKNFATKPWDTTGGPEYVFMAAPTYARIPKPPPVDCGWLMRYDGTRIR